MEPTNDPSKKRKIINFKVQLNDEQKLAKHNRTAPSGSPETVNHQKPPSYHIKEIFKLGGRQDYNKPIHGKKILEKNDLMIAIQVCPELKAFVNQIISLCDESKIIS
jgi:hypothetical protein